MWSGVKGKILSVEYYKFSKLLLEACGKLNFKVAKVKLNTGLAIEGVGIKSKKKNYFYQIDEELDGTVTETARNLNVGLKPEHIKFPEKTKETKFIALYSVSSQFDQNFVHKYVHYLTKKTDIRRVFTSM